MPKKSPNSKKKEKQEQSPSNSRSIPDLLKQFHMQTFQHEWKTIVFSFIVGLFLMGILYIGGDSLRLLDELEMKKQERVLLQEKIDKWEAIVSARPDYRDGYFTLALLYYQSGDRQNAEQNLLHVKTLDPQFENTKILEETFQGR